jgi:large subunit ribosomal protein L13
MTMKTFRLSARSMDRRWHVLDAADTPLGRVASEAAKLLLGKHKPNYEPFLPMGDYVVIINADRVAVTGEKTKRKVYYRHSGYPGGLRERTLEEQMDRDSRKVLERAIKGMLPHNSRGRELFRHLNVYSGSEHPHEAQVNAGTGARAQKRARQEAVAAAAAPVAAAPEPVEPETATPEPEMVEEVAAPEAAVPEAPTAAEVPAVEATTSEPAGDRLTGSLARHKRAELDEEATRLGIEIESGWKKDDVVAAVQGYYDEHPIADEDDA